MDTLPTLCAQPQPFVLAWCIGNAVQGAADAYVTRVE